MNEILYSSWKNHVKKDSCFVIVCAFFWYFASRYQCNELDYMIIGVQKERSFKILQALAISLHIDVKTKKWSKTRMMCC